MTDPYEPLHARPPVRVEAPRLISVLAILVDEDGGKSAQKASRQDVECFIGRCYKHFNETPPHVGQGKHLYDRFVTQQMIKEISGDTTFCVMQKHTSFFSVFFYRADNSEAGRFAWSAVPDGLLEELGGSVAFKTHIRVERADPNRNDHGYELLNIFNCGADAKNGFSVSDIYTELFASKVSDGGAAVWTPFKSFSDGFNRILIRDISLRPARLGRLVRRLAEIDMYVALGGRNFYKAQEQLKTFAQHERDLKNIVDEESFVRAENDRELYKHLSAVSKKVASLIAETRYDFQATLAFSELVSQRIRELREERLEGWTRIGYFLDRTFRPCVRTCESALRYQIAVSQGIQEAASLLGAGLNLLIEEDSVTRAEENKKILSQLHVIAESSAKLLKQQHKREERQRDLRSRIELIALLPIMYYLSQILYHTINNISTPWAISISLAAAFLFWILITRMGRACANKLTARLSEDR